MRISETLELSIPDDVDIDKLERYLAREIKEFERRVFVKVLQEIKAKKLEEAKDRVGCQEEVPRYLFTRLGLIRFERHKVKYKERGKFGFFLDDILGLKPYQVATRWVGSGGVEKNIDIILCRRFKGRGMSWSRAGAQNLLKLRLLKHDRKDWKSYWRSRIN